MQSRKRLLLHPASAAAILGIDGSVHALSWFFELELMSRAVVSGAIFCGLVVFLVENVTRPSATSAAALKGATAVAVVAAPGPLLGTSLALCALAWWVAVSLAQRSARPPR